MTRAALALALLCGCHAVEYTQRIPAQAAQRLLAAPHDGPFVAEDADGQPVRIAPDSQLRLVYLGPDHTLRRSPAVTASDLRAAAGGLTLPSAASIPWRALDSIEVRHVSVARTVLWFLAGAVIFAGCTYYDCYAQVPR